MANIIQELLPENVIEIVFSSDKFNKRVKNQGIENPMNNNTILAIETSSNICGISLIKNGTFIDSIDEDKSKTCRSFTIVSRASN